MKKVLIIVGVVVVVLAVGGLGGFAIFEHFDHAGKIKASKASCTGKDTVDASAVVPTGLTLPDGQTLLRVRKQGSTAIAYAKTPGGRPDLVKIRDAVLSSFTSAGFKVTHKDQEPTYEADGDVSMSGVDIGINVQPLCSGQAVVRYTVSH